MRSCGRTRRTIDITLISTTCTAWNHSLFTNLGTVDKVDIPHCCSTDHETEYQRISWVERDPIRITESNSWLHPGPPKSQTIKYNTVSLAKGVSSLSQKDLKSHKGRKIYWHHRHSREMSRVARIDQKRGIQVNMPSWFCSKISEHIDTKT